MTKRRLRKWVKVVIAVLIITLGIFIYKDFSKERVVKTPAGTYTCNGGIVKVCTGSRTVANYLGV